MVCWQPCTVVRGPGVDKDMCVKLTVCVRWKKSTGNADLCRESCGFLSGMRVPRVGLGGLLVVVVRVRCTTAGACEVIVAMSCTCIVLLPVMQGPLCIETHGDQCRDLACRSTKVAEVVTENCDCRNALAFLLVTVLHGRLAACQGSILCNQSYS